MLTDVNLAADRDLSPTFEVAINEMRNSRYQFALTGSRYHNTTTPSSDWDFFVQDSDNVRKFLNDLGFVPESVTYSRYKDSFTDAVYVLHNKDHSKRIHVQLVKDFDAKKWANTQIKINGFSEVIRKPSLNHWKIIDHRARIWNLFGELYKLKNLEKKNQFLTGEVSTLRNLYRKNNDDNKKLKKKQRRLGILTLIHLIVCTISLNGGFPPKYVAGLLEYVDPIITMLGL